MSATISGIIVLENASPVNGLPLTVCFDGQIWLGAGHILTGSFHYYNATNDTFPDIGHYFAWIHVCLLMSLLIFLCHCLYSSSLRQVAKYVPFGQTQVTPLNDHALDSETQRTESQSDEESRVGNTLNMSTSPTIDFHVTGNIVHVHVFFFV
jgi:hypothetical protein